MTQIWDSMHNSPFDSANELFRLFLQTEDSFYHVWAFCKISYEAWYCRSQPTPAKAPCQQFLLFSAVFPSKIDNPILGKRAKEWFLVRELCSTLPWCPECLRSADIPLTWSSVQNQTDQLQQTGQPGYSQMAGQIPCTFAPWVWQERGFCEWFVNLMTFQMWDLETLRGSQVSQVLDLINVPKPHSHWAFVLLPTILKLVRGKKRSRCLCANA